MRVRFKRTFLRKMGILRGPLWTRQGDTTESDRDGWVWVKWDGDLGTTLEKASSLEGV
jgi:hypothetical protein